MPHPFVKLCSYVVHKTKQVSANRKRRKAENAEAKLREAEEGVDEDGEGTPKRKLKKPPGALGRMMGMFRRKKEADESDSDDDDTTKEAAMEEWDGNVSGSSEGESEEWDGEEEEDEYEEEEELDAFRPGEYTELNDLEPITRLGPEDINELEETMHRMNPKYVKAESMVYDGKMELAVNERLARLRRANKFNALIAFGAPMQIPLNPGNVKIPTLISVAGHHGLGGNVGINGVYERYPDNHHGRPVYQKYLEREQWLNELHQVELCNGARGFVSQDLEDDENWRTFPTVHDSPRSKHAMTQSMVSVKVLGSRHLPGAVGHFEYVHKTESWFIFFDDLLGAWCIGPKPGNCEVFARCYGVDEAIPDNLGPDRWQVFDVGHRIWYTHKNLRTMKGGLVSAANSG